MLIQISAESSNFTALLRFLNVTFPYTGDEGFTRIWDQPQIRWLSCRLSHSSTVSSCNRCFQRNRTITSDLHLLCSCSTGPPLASGPWFHKRPTCQCRVHQEGRRSHYSYNEIIMNGAPRPHHRNIYCIIYSASPLVQGERTHINFQARSSPPHSSSCLLLKAEVPARSRSRFHSFFFFRSVSLLFFLPRCGTGSIHRGPEALTQSGLPAVDALRLPSSLFFYLLSCFSVCFFLFCCFFSYNWSCSILPKDYKQELTGICGMHS